MYRVESLPISIPIGRQGENHAMKIEIDCSSFLAEWPQATITAMLRRSVAENPYILVTSIDSSGILTWEPTAHDTGIEGDGQIEIRAVENDVLAKSVTAIVCVERSLTPPEPDTPIDWVENIKSDIAQSVTSAANSASDAAKSAASAQESATAAAGSAAAAQSSANAAAGSASAASKSAASAATSADAASGSASAAAQSAGDADASAKASAASAAEAAGTLDSVKASADAAAASARAAAESASGAAGSKSAAAQSATDAAGSASAAAGSATQSAAARDAAQAAQTAAAQSASDAADSATAASGSKDAAAQSAGEAAASAEAAAQSATAAAGIIDDTVITEKKAWSSKNTVDKLLPMQKVTGNPVAIETLEGYPLELSASWEPKQDGSGTPSPDNVRPITGTKLVTLRESNANLLNPADIVNRTFAPYNLRIDLVDKSTLRIKGTWQESETRSFVIMELNNKLLSGRGLKIADTVTNGTPLAHTLYGLRTRDETAIALATAEGGWPPGTAVDMTLKVGVYAPETALTEYQPYNGKDLSLTLPHTIYGGKIDPATGKGHETWDYIDSYAGETLPGEWISDRDEYAAGATPTMGAQVAYKLATPVPFTATGGQTSLALDGTNIIITDTDTLTVGGVKPIRKLIDDTRVGTDNVWSAKHTVGTLLPMQKVTGNPVTIETLAGYPLELSASWEPIQEGEGEPSQDNVRPIKGRDNVKITRKNKTQEDSITLTLPTTIYGGEVDVETGMGYEKWEAVELNGTERWQVRQVIDTYSYVVSLKSRSMQGICSHYKKLTYADVGSSTVAGTIGCYMEYSLSAIFNVPFASIEAWKSYLAAQYAAGTPVQIVYKSDAPESFAATGGGRIDALAGPNTISTDADTLIATAPTLPQTTASAAERQAAKLDYVAMMADVDVDDLTAVDDAGADADMDMDMPTGIEGSETDGKQEV